MSNEPQSFTSCIWMIFCLNKDLPNETLLKLSGTSINVQTDGMEYTYRHVRKVINYFEKIEICIV